MVKVEVKLSAMSNISYNPTEVLEWDDEDWNEMTDEQRLELVREEAEAFIADDIEWNWKVL